MHGIMLHLVGFLAKELDVLVVQYMVLPAQEAYATRHTNLIRRELKYGYIRTHYRHNGRQYCVEGCYYEKTIFNFSRDIYSNRLSK